jgi:hypothetical protein
MIEKFTTEISINTKGEAIRFAKECYEVADEYAIDFACWLFEDMEITKVQKLLKLFKQYNKMNLPKEL